MLCPVDIIDHTDRPFHSCIQNSGGETTSNILGSLRLLRTSLQPAEHHIWTHADWPQSQICPKGKIMTNDFYFHRFSLENLRIFQWWWFIAAVFTALTFQDWQRGRIGFKNTYTFHNRASRFNSQFKVWFRSWVSALSCWLENLRHSAGFTFEKEQDHTRVWSCQQHRWSYSSCTV